MLRATLFLALMSSPALADGLFDRFSANGTFHLGYSNRTAGADAFLVGDGTARLSFGRFGFELGVYGRADALDTPHETYGAATLDIGTNGRIAVGVPRSAYDQFAVSAPESSFPSLAIDRTASTRSAATFGAMFGGWLPYGALFSFDDGDMRFAISAHHSELPGDTVIGAGAARGIGGIHLSAALEATSGDVSAKAQIMGPIGPATAGLAYYAPSIAGAPDMVEVFGSYDVTEQLAVTAIAQVPTNGGNATAGVSEKYDFSDNVGVSLGVASDAGANTVVSGFLTFAF